MECPWGETCFLAQMREEREGRGKDRGGLVSTVAPWTLPRLPSAQLSLFPSPGVAAPPSPGLPSGRSHSASLAPIPSLTEVLRHSACGIFFFSLYHFLQMEKRQKVQGKSGIVLSSGWFCKGGVIVWEL